MKVFMHDGDELLVTDQGNAGAMVKLEERSSCRGCGSPQARGTVIACVAEGLEHGDWCTGCITIVKPYEFLGNGRVNRGIKYIWEQDDTLQWSKDGQSYVLVRPTKAHSTRDTWTHPFFGQVLVVSINGIGEVRWVVSRPYQTLKYLQSYDAEVLGKFGVDLEPIS